MFHISLKNTSGWVLLTTQQSNKFCGFSDDSRSCEQLKKHVTDKYFEKKLRLGTLITFCYRKYMLVTILEWLVSTWCTCLTKILEEKRLKLSNYLNQIWGHLATLSALQCFLFFGPKLQRKIGWVLQTQTVTWCPKEGIYKKWEAAFFGYQWVIHSI